MGWGGGCQCETERQHIISNSQPMRWDLSEPSLSLILLWILKYPHLSISLTNSFPPTSSYSFFFPLLFIQPLVFVLLLEVHDALLSVSFIFSFCLFITVRMGFMSYHEAVKTRASPRGVAVREQSRERDGEGGVLFVVSHWIFHLNPWNIHHWGRG